MSYIGRLQGSFDSVKSSPNYGICRHCKKPRVMGPPTKAYVKLRANWVCSFKCLKELKALNELGREERVKKFLEKQVRE